MSAPDAFGVESDFTGARIERETHLVKFFVHGHDHGAMCQKIVLTIQNRLVEISTYGGWLGCQKCLHVPPVPVATDRSPQVLR